MFVTFILYSTQCKYLLHIVFPTQLRHDSLNFISLFFRLFNKPITLSELWVCRQESNIDFNNRNYVLSFFLFHIKALRYTYHIYRKRIHQHNVY